MARIASERLLKQRSGELRLAGVQRDLTQLEVRLRLHGLQIDGPLKLRFCVIDTLLDLQEMSKAEVRCGVLRMHEEVGAKMSLRVREVPIVELDPGESIQGLRVTGRQRKGSFEGLLSQLELLHLLCLNAKIAKQHGVIREVRTRVHKAGKCGVRSARLPTLESEPGRSGQLTLAGYAVAKIDA